MDIDKSGQVPQKPVREIWFFNDETGEISFTDDLKLKLRCRNKRLTFFYEKYKSLFKKRRVSVILIVGCATKYKSASQLKNTIKRKLSRLSVQLLADYWQRDTGDIRFQQHYHLIIITRRLMKFEIKKVLSKNKNSQYSIELCKSFTAFYTYLRTKQVFAPNGARSFGVSKKFRIPAY